MSTPIPDFLRLALLAFADQVMASREPDFTAGDDYLRRWHLGPYGSSANAYIHLFTGDDEDGALHDHPYDNVSVILRSGYDEHFHTLPKSVKDGKFATHYVPRGEGDVVFRKADVAHRLSLRDGKPCVSLFLPGLREREWGFHCVSGWVPFAEFLKPNGGRKGCAP